MLIKTQVVDISGELSHVITDAGTYYLWVYDDNYVEGGSYNLTLQKVNPPVNAVDVVYGDLKSGVIGASAEVDVYRFTAEAGESVVIPVTAPSGFGPFDPTVRLYSSAGVLIKTQSVDISGELSQVITEAGTYYLWVYDNNYLEGGSYSFTLTLNPPPIVTITAPLDGDSVVEGDTISIRATAEDDGSIASVTFIIDGVEQAAFTAAPYRLDYEVPTGISSFVLDVKAIDNYEASTMASRTVPVVVDPLTTVLGTVKTSDGVLVSGASIYLTKAGLTTTSSVDGSFNIANASTVLGAMMVRASALVNGQAVYARSEALTPVPAGVTNAGILILKGLPFYSGQKFAASAGQTDMIEADVNRDGIPDVVTINSAGELVFHIGYGDGRFEAQSVLVATGSGMRKVAVADLNNDTRPDVAISQQGSNNVAVFLAKKNGSFAAQQNFVVGTAPSYGVVADVNNDGLADVLTANQTSNDVSLMMGLGDGLFAAEQRLTVG